MKKQYYYAVGAGLNYDILEILPSIRIFRKKSDGVWKVLVTFQWLFLEFHIALDFAG